LCLVWFGIAVLQYILDAVFYAQDDSKLRILYGLITKG
jgi:hypothetical protein